MNTFLLIVVLYLLGAVFTHFGFWLVSIMMLYSGATPEKPLTGDALRTAWKLHDGDEWLFHSFVMLMLWHVMILFGITMVVIVTSSVLWQAIVSLVTRSWPKWFTFDKLAKVMNNRISRQGE